jgi:hypothetical protein
LATVKSQLAQSSTRVQKPSVFRLVFDQIPAFRNVRLQVVQFLPALFVKLDKLVVAGANDSTRFAALVGVMRVVPEERVPLSALEQAHEAYAIDFDVVLHPADVQNGRKEINAADG